MADLTPPAWLRRSRHDRLIEVAFLAAIVTGKRTGDDDIAIFEPHDFRGEYRHQFQLVTGTAPFD